MTQVHRRHAVTTAIERRGDARILTIDKSEAFRGGRLVILAHDDGGVTVQMFIAGNEQRVTFSRDDWRAARDHVDR